MIKNLKFYSLKKLLNNMFTKFKKKKKWHKLLGLGIDLGQRRGYFSLAST